MTNLGDEFENRVDEEKTGLRSELYDEEQAEFFTREVKIDATNLNDEFIKQADLYHRASVAYESASSEESRLKTALELAYGMLDPQIRAQMTDQGIKVTEGRVDAGVKTHPDYIAVEARYHAARANASLWRAACKALEHKKDMLIQLGANYRAEGSSDTSLKSLDKYKK